MDEWDQAGGQLFDGCGNARGWRSALHGWAEQGGGVAAAVRGVARLLLCPAVLLLMS